MACGGRAGGKRAKGANLWKVLNLKRNESARGWVGAGGDQVLQRREIREGEPGEAHVLELREDGTKRV